MDPFTLIGLAWKVISSRVGIIAVSALAIAVLVGLLKLEHSGKLKAQTEKATAQTAAEISQQMILLYQDREEITAKASKKRGKLNELQKKNDLDGLADDFNASNGVRQPMPANPGGSAKAAARYKTAGGAGPEYEEAR